MYFCVRISANRKKIHENGHSGYPQNIRKLSVTAPLMNDVVKEHLSVKRLSEEDSFDRT